MNKILNELRILTDSCLDRFNIHVKYKFGNKRNIIIELVEYNFQNSISIDTEESRLIQILQSFPDVLEKYLLNNKLIKMENFENNWNELEEWLQERKFVYNITGEDLDEDMSITEVLMKMQEIKNRK